MQDVEFNFMHKIAVVTGGASGIGKATARMLVDAGAAVFLVDIDKEAGEAAARELGGNAKFFCADVSDRAALSSIGKELNGERVDILVNNAGIEYNDRGTILTMPDDSLRRIVDVNLWGYINVARAVVPFMGRGGRIVNVSSIQGLAAHRPGTSYQVAKAGILGLTHALAVELARTEVVVNTVAPGAIKTEGMGNARTEDSGMLDPYRRRIPLGRRGRAHEVAGAVMFLCSSLASYITGATLVVDGGYTIQLTPDVPSLQIPRVSGDPDIET